MTSSPPTRSVMQSSASLPSLSVLASSSVAGAFDGDAAASICAFLILKGGFTCGHVAHNLGLPSLVVEECVRNGESSAALRAQLGQWLQENQRTASTVPPFLVRYLHEACVADELAQQRQTRQNATAGAETQTRGGGSASPRPATTTTTSSSPSVAPSGEDDSSLFSALDPLSRQHFTALHDSVGQSFISILNDPGESTEGAAWGSWLGGKLYDAFDYNGRTSTNHLEEALRLLQLRRQQDPESSASLLLQHPPQTDFTDYVRAVSAAYNTNRRENREVRESALMERRLRPEELPWPHAVPATFFKVDYDPSGDVAQLPMPMPTTAEAVAAAEALSNALPTTTTGKAGEETAATVSTTRIVGAGTFRKDYEAIEERNKELRAWEGEVERCLLQHVQSRSEDFFFASAHFTQLSEEGTVAMGEAAEARTGGIAKGTASIKELLGVGGLYRRRRNFNVLTAFLNRALKVFHQLQDIDNWATLPERDIAELPGVARRLLDLEAFLRTGDREKERHSSSSSGGGAEGSLHARAQETPDTPDTPHSPPDSWRWMSRLKLMKDVPQRTVAARMNLESLVQDELVGCLTRDLSESKRWPRTTRAIEAAALLGVLEPALLTYHTTVVRAQWASVQESVVSFLMSSNTLDDAKANELLSHSTASATSEPTTEEKKSLLAYTNDCRYSVFVNLLSQLVDRLTENVSRATQNWGFALSECFPKALGLYGDSQELMRKTTHAFLGTVCSHAESVIALLLDVRSCSKAVTAAPEIDTIAKLAFSFVTLAMHPVQQLAAIPDLPLASLAGGGNVEDTALRLGKQIHTGVHRLAKRFLRNQHARHMEKLQMVVESETWAPKEDVDAVFQSHVEQLCKCDAAAVAAFDAKNSETEDQSYSSASAAATGNGQQCQQQHGSSGGGGENASKASKASKGGRSNRNNKDEDDDADADLLNAKANKLYLSLDGEDDGRVVGNSLLILVELLSAYDDLLAKFPSLGYDVVSRAYELLALYDSLCAGMVLGARAMEKGTLKSITTTHLCVASQCAAFLADLIPHLQARFMAVLRVTDTATTDTTTISTSAAYTLTSARKLKPFITNDLGRVAKDCASHRNDFFHKMATLVLMKVDSLGAMAANGEWTARGNEWVMTMLREAARLIRALRPLLPAGDLRGVVVPLLGSLAVKIREVARGVPASATDARSMATSDVLLFKLNVERFGFDVLRCAGISSVAAAMTAENLTPVATDQEALAWFFAPRASAQHQQHQQWANAKKA